MFRRHTELHLMVVQVFYLIFRADKTQNNKMKLQFMHLFHIRAVSRNHDSLHINTNTQTLSHNTERLLGENS